MTFFLGLILIISGLLLLAHWSLLALAMIGAGAWLMMRAGRAGEERFVAALMTLGGLGALVEIWRWMTGR